MQIKYDSHFRQFAGLLEQVICGHGGNEGDQTERQKAQVENLVRLEREFRDALIQDCRGPAVYSAFVRFIMDDRKNILAARPYFRERQEVFKEEIAPILRARQYEGLHKFNINYSFIAFALARRRFGPNSKVMLLAQSVKKARQELIELNIPLAISRAKLFKQHTPQSHLEYMDLVQIANEGLIAAVDKFVLPYTPVFRAVIIGRISGYHIEEYSDTMLHFYPSDKRKIYRANKANGRSGTVPIEDLVKEVNKDAKKSHTTNEDELHQLLVASSHVSMDAPPTEASVTDGEPESSIDRYAADPECQPDVQVEAAEARAVLRKAIAGLTLLERKLLKMKGIEI